MVPVQDKRQLILVPFGQSPDGADKWVWGSRDALEQRLDQDDIALKGRAHLMKVRGEADLLLLLNCLNVHQGCAMQALVQLLCDACRLLRLVIIRCADVGDLGGVAAPCTQVIRSESCEVQCYDHLFQSGSDHRADQLQIEHPVVAHSGELLLEDGLLLPHVAVCKSVPDGSHTSCIVYPVITEENRVRFFIGLTDSARLTPSPFISRSSGRG